MMGTSTSPVPSPLFSLILYPLSLPRLSHRCTHILPLHFLFFSPILLSPVPPLLSYKVTTSRTAATEKDNHFSLIRIHAWWISTSCYWVDPKSQQQSTWVGYWHSHSPLKKLLGFKSLYFRLSLLPMPCPVLINRPAWSYLVWIWGITLLKSALLEYYSF